MNEGTGRAPKIRKLTPADTAAYRQLRLRRLKDDPDAWITSYADESAKPFSTFRDELSSRETLVLGAFAGKGLIGMVGSRRDPRVKIRHKAEIWGMYVQPEFRGRGLGRALIVAALDQLRRARGVLQVNLIVFRGNRNAMALYRSLGFRRYGLEKRAVLVDGRALDDEYMVLRLR